MKVLTRSRYETATYCSGWARSDRQRPVAAANRGRPFLSECTDDNRSRYYKGGLSEASPPSLPVGTAQGRLCPPYVSNCNNVVASTPRVAYQRRDGGGRKIQLLRRDIAGYDDQDRGEHDSEH